jgi:putative nucleotidyltransferase with HDIG domain
MGQPAPPASPSRIALNAYIAMVVSAGVFVLADAVHGAVRTPYPLAWLSLSALALLTGFCKLQFAGLSADIAIDDTFFIATALLFGPGPATLAFASSGLVCRYRKQVRQLLFNTATFAISMWSASHAFYALARVKPLAVGHDPIAPLVMPLLAMTAVYFLLNSGLIALAVGLDSRQSPFAIWRTHFGWIGVGYFGAASVAFIVILLIQQASLAAVIVVLPLLAVLYLTLRASFGRVSDAHRHLAEVDRLYLSTVETLAMAIDAKDDVTHSHVRRVQAYAMALARAMGVNDTPTLKAIEAAALLHDTGKLAIPEHILNKPGKLTDVEFEKMKLHADIGADILSLVNFPFPVEPIVRCHHENWDGTGYPRGIAGEAIPIGARILSVVDCFDALTSDRPYRRRLPDEDAVAILRERSGTMYDPQAVQTFIGVYESVDVDLEETPEQREVLNRISATKRDTEPAAGAPVAAPFGMTHDLLTFVSLARLASGDASLLDVLAIASNLVRDIIPGVTGGWYLRQERHDRLVVVDAFGPAASAIAGATVGVGERLTGWVAASGQAIVNSDATLDLGLRTDIAAAGLRRCMSVPLTVGSASVAVLTLYSPDEKAFALDRARLVQVIAPHLAAAIDAACKAEQKHAAPEPRRELRLVGR